MEEAFVSVAEQVLVQNSKIVTVGGDTFSVITTSKQKLKQVNFRLDGREFRGLQQNPGTKSRWAEIARDLLGLAAPVQTERKQVAPCPTPSRLGLRARRDHSFVRQLCT